MNIRQFFLGALLVAVTTTVSAHLDGHDDEAQPITAQEASVIADHAIGALVKEKRLDGSWAKVQPQKIKPQGTGERSYLGRELQQSRREGRQQERLLCLHRRAGQLSRFEPQR